EPQLLILLDEIVAQLVLTPEVVADLDHREAHVDMGERHHHRRSDAERDAQDRAPPKATHAPTTEPGAAHRAQGVRLHTARRLPRETNQPHPRSTPRNLAERARGLRAISSSDGTIGWRVSSVASGVARMPIFSATSAGTPGWRDRSRKQSFTNRSSS